MMKHLQLYFLFFISFSFSVNSFAQVKKITPPTKPTFQYDEFVDERDGKTYKTIKIGNQVWMAENFAYLPKLNYYGTSERGDNYTPVYNVYRNDLDGTRNENQDIEARSEDLKIVKISDSYKTYGVLYNYAAAKLSCPKGWHLPSDKEWQELEMNLGMNEDEINNINVYRNSGSVGEMLKSTTLWAESGLKGTDKVGFNALPAGERDDNYFTGRGSYAMFWGSSSNGSQQCAVSRRISAYDDGVYRECSSWWNTKSVRYVKD